MLLLEFIPNTTYCCTYRVPKGMRGKCWLKMDTEVTKTCKIVTFLSIIGQVQIFSQPETA